MSRVTNDDLEQKLDGITAALGIQTTTSNVLYNIQTELGQIRGYLATSDRRFRQSLWLTPMACGVALVGAGLTSTSPLVMTILGAILVLFGFWQISQVRG
jgi:hypothetical protein